MSDFGKNLMAIARVVPFPVIVDYLGRPIDVDVSRHPYDAYHLAIKLPKRISTKQHLEMNVALWSMWSLHLHEIFPLHGGGPFTSYIFFSVQWLKHRRVTAPPEIVVKSDIQTSFYSNIAISFRKTRPPSWVNRLVANRLGPVIYLRAGDSVIISSELMWSGNGRKSR